MVGTDDSKFLLYQTFEMPFTVVQEFTGSSFALAAKFSPTGKFLALGDQEGYRIVRLGPLFGIDLVPLQPILPQCVLSETLFRSGNGPSLVQRFMINGDKECLKWVAATLKSSPDCMYTFDRKHGERCLDTALRLHKIKLLQLFVTTLVDGSLDAENKQQSILTTDIPQEGKKALQIMIQCHPPEYTIAVLRSMTFIKVPFTQQHLLSRDQILTCGSPSYLDPWDTLPLVDSKDGKTGKAIRTPAVLPSPGLGTMSFLSDLVWNAPAEAFDNEVMAGEYA